MRSGDTCRPAVSMRSSSACGLVEGRVRTASLRDMLVTGRVVYAARQSALFEECSGEWREPQESKCTTQSITDAQMRNMKGEVKGSHGAHALLCGREAEEEEDAQLEINNSRCGTISDVLTTGIWAGCGCRGDERCNQLALSRPRRRTPHCFKIPGRDPQILISLGLTDVTVDIRPRFAYPPITSTPCCDKSPVRARSARCAHCSEKYRSLSNACTPKCSVKKAIEMATRLNDHEPAQYDLQGPTMTAGHRAWFSLIR
jgi:hypothetical protein